jgi:hypothetical protein
MIQQFGLPTFFITFTSTKRLWDPFIKILHTLRASKLNLPNKIEDLQSVHIIKLIRINPITHYYQSGVQFTSLNHYGTLKVK